MGAQAAHLGFVNDTPITNMHQRDVDSIKKAVLGALGQKDGAGNRVKIDATMMVARTAADSGHTCRDLGVVLNAKGQSMNLHPQFCKEGSGAWQLQKK